MKRLVVPANLLLVGEYAITERGGTGIAIAIEPVVSLIVDPEQPFSITGRFAVDTEVRFTTEDLGRDGLIPRAATCFVSRARLDTNALSGSLLIDSREFSDSSGAKIGLGSSAAVTVALCIGIAVAAGADDDEAVGLAAAHAVEAHRAAQGGRGSGYDVLASLHGGVGRVIGGDTPAWETITLSWLGAIGIRRSRNSVATSGAIDRYRSWRKREPLLHRRFLERSNAAVERVASATLPADAMAAIESAAKIGVDLGDRIGVPAGVPAETGCDAEGPWRCKSLGAGDELAGVISPVEALPRGFRRCRIDSGGARWV